MSDLVTLSHGSGGRQARNLVNRIFADKFRMRRPLTDSALLEVSGGKLAFTTDAYVVDPLFFPGGNIGKLAICGTVNDLAVAGAVPAFISASFIIEEGFPIKDLEKIASSMAEEAELAGVRIVTGDTKVVERGKCDRLFITTSGTGLIPQGREHISQAENVIPGDKLIINGPLGNHAVAIMASRKNLSFSTPVKSDCASMNHMIKAILEGCSGVHFMRDLTRGGLAAVANELTEMTGLCITLNETEIPVEEPVRGLCEILGFDPLSLANEGRVLIVSAREEYTRVLEILHTDPLGNNAAVIGEMTNCGRKMVILNTASGGRRVVEMPSGIILPRIC